MKLRGVNFGGWLLIERWMLPGLFEGTDAIDEYTFMQTPGARAKLRQHQKTFIQEEDFKWLRDNGLNAIRIPVGYWIFEGDPPFVSSIGRLDWAFRMAEKYQLHVIVCLFGAPGSQNGRDHSGRVGPADWYKQPAYRQKSIETLTRLTERYGHSPALWGVELLNEPKVGLLQRTLRTFYTQAHSALSSLLPDNATIVFHDAFTPRLLNGALMTTKSRRVAMDIHWYHFGFPLFLWTPLSWYYRVVDWHGRLIKRLQKWHLVIIGEWNGIVAGQILDKYPKKDHDRIVAEHAARQLRAYENADGWFYWSYKTEARGVWHFRSMVEDGWITLKNDS